MRVLVLITLLITACLPEDEISISQSNAISGQDLTNVNSPAHIEQGECLINVNGTLALNKRTSTLSLPNNQCLPSSKLSWLFRAEEVKTKAKYQLPHLRLAILFDTSFSLQKQDSERKRFDAIKTYLKAIFARKMASKISNTEVKGKIASADIKVFPFKYCDQTKGANAHVLRITSSTTEANFDSAIDALIGTNADITGNEIVITDGVRGTLKEYGAGGSTNYLQSLAWAEDFLEQGDKDDLKHVVIISDGLPFTYNDGNTTTITNEKCSLDKDDFSSSAAKNCVTTEHYPSKYSCTAPTSDDDGLTANTPAFDDPRNHLLGMIQHSQVINKAKRGKFNVYAAHLNNCRTKITDDSFSEQYLCQQVSQPFFESFVEEGGYVPADDADELAKALEKILSAQLPQKIIDYKYFGTAHIGTASKGSSTTTVDQETKRHRGNFIKVGRDKKSSSPTYDVNKHGVYDYADSGQDVLTVEHGLFVRGGSFEIDYDFNFSAAKGGSDCRNQSPTTSGNLEVHKYDATSFTAWCLLAPPSCDDSTHCCENGQVVSYAAGQQRCAAQGKNWVWIGFQDKTKVCDCVCDADGTGKAACQGEGQIWNKSTCTCEQGVAAKAKTTTCVPTETVCCKSGVAQAQPICQSKSGETLDIDSCSCVPDTSSPPTQSQCDSNRECCIGDRVVTSGSCGSNKQVWRGHPTCGCVCRNSASSCNAQTHTWHGFPTCNCVRKTSPKVDKPTTPDQDEDGTIGGDDAGQGDVTGQKEEPENPQKAGKVVGGTDAKPTTGAVEGIVWGDFESF